jgi:hypothetical protein
MLRLVADENFNGAILRGLLLRLPKLDIVRIQDHLAEGTEDSAILEWAQANNRIIVTHDKKTFPGFAYKHMATGARVAGLFIVKPEISIAQAIDDLFLLCECSETSEWENAIVYFPL